MKKILLLFLACICLFFKCVMWDKERCNCAAPYEVGLSMELREIKGPSVKSIKVTLKNLTKPEYEIVSYYFLTKREIDEIHEKTGSVDLPNEGGGIVKQDRKQYVSDDEKTYYFRDIRFYLGREDFTPGKKRIYELKMYVNDKLFFTKKIWFTPKEKVKGYLYSDKVEVDNREYVKKISSDFRPSWNWLIEITDADVKKFLEK